ncbi:MAG: hypothetical protein UV73_C0014G0002 [Candidatus Gottesmanbacteria bacterium GW2011_GWA2_43_14]|uniref:Uncharacterized protein n=1 Tax=Candidatus Gottesmanbacteria bacterium GW2011_GWA2_43_14 TaxID=1618443 RepID=A0A0G1DD11_9BACT|nr:MAG: hypothetical protein UV73_C0014G0002 [Candidatus Gottesmanbacteria bacterium GW2011_GWA2_43_14]
MNEQSPKQASSKLLLPILSAALLISLIFGIVSFKLYFNTQKKIRDLESQSSPNSQLPDEREIKNIMEKAGRHLVLPTGSPQLITVSNVEQLQRDSSFFTNAKNGHKLLIYTNKVIIYDPDMDKIVDIAFISTPASPSAIPSVNTPPAPTVTP